ncbi:hypothetical protein [Sphingomonas turrisvirgatae]|uniref:Uncharacterized protein n=1 Tax=Sphingomonas turrisvirgatae TaxID=1888892 RepID=A0A1E3LXT4_9SPHN|nr:hypothetical protein [Sphingomonas turrisvirgatae]ODP38601.1 hypothetical protein BFL28_00735 [Sphingomonas turrisvirgatae]
MILAALSLMLAAQQTTPQPPLQSGLPPAPWREMPGTPDEPEGEGRAPTWAYRSATCVVKNSGDKVATALAKDFRSPDYQRSFATIFQNNGGCFGTRGRLPRPSLVLTGALAERLLMRDAAPLNARLARAATGPAVVGQSLGDAAATCTVRSIPDDVAAWLATEPMSPDAIARSQPVQMVFDRCAKNDPNVKFTGNRLRALVALAAWRSLSPAAAPASK